GRISTFSISLTERPRSSSSRWKAGQFWGRYPYVISWLLRSTGCVGAVHRFPAKHPARVLHVAVAVAQVRHHVEDVEAQRRRRLDAGLDHAHDVALAAPHRDVARGGGPVLGLHAAAARCTTVSTSLKAGWIAARSPRSAWCVSTPGTARRFSARSAYLPSMCFLNAPPMSPLSPVTSSRRGLNPPARGSGRSPRAPGAPSDRARPPAENRGAATRTSPGCGRGRGSTPPTSPTGRARNRRSWSR